jgi:hypothetical protein
MIKYCLTFCLSVFLSCVTSYSQINANFGIYIKNLTVDQKNGLFYADLYWWIKLPDSISTESEKEYAKIEFVNGSEISNSVVESKRAKGIIYITGFCKGEFKFEPNYHDYPVDVQRLPIIIESVNLTEDLVRLVPDTASGSRANTRLMGLDENIAVAGYNVLNAGYLKDVKTYKSNFGDPEFSEDMKYSRLVYEINIARDSESFILKILIPNLLLLVISYLVFFIPPNQLEVAVGCTVTSLLASIALQLTINNNLPDIGYITNADKLFHLFYLLITIALVQTVISFNLDKRGKSHFANRIEVWGRIIFPLILITGIMMILK